MANVPAVTVVITTRNNEDIIKPCVDSVICQDYPNLSCVIADDYSTDHTLDIVKKSCPQAKIVVNYKQEGPSRNRNLALQEVSSPYVLFMDSDATLGSGWVRQAVEVMENDWRIGILGGKIFNGDGTAQATDSFFHITGVSGFKAERDVDLASYLWWPSSTMMARTDLIKEIGGFDEVYCYHYEDSDIGWRVNIAGFKVTYCNRLHSTHRLSTTVKKEWKRRKIMFMTKRNKVITLLKNLEWSSLIKYGWFIFGFWVVELVMLPCKKEVLAGNLAGVLALPHIIKERRSIRRYRKKSDRELSQHMSFSLGYLLKMYFSK